MKKRGVSGIVVTVILVALSIALISIVWAVIANLIDTSLDNAETSLTKIELNIIDGSVTNSSNTEFSLKVDRSYDENNLTKMRFLISSKTDETEEKIIESNLPRGEGKIYFFDTDSFSTIATTDDLKKISVSPIILRNGKEETLPISDTHEFKL